MPDPIIPYQPFGTIPSWPPSPAKLDRDLDAQHHHIINVDWSTSQINLTTDVTGQLPYANIQNVTAQRLLGRDTGVGIVQEIIIGANLTLAGGTLSAATSGGAGLGDFSTNTATSVADEIVLFADATGKMGKRSTGTGVAHLTSGRLSVSNVQLGGEVTGVLPAANVAVLPTANIADLAVTNAKLAGGITASNLVATDIDTVGTITTGTWAGNTVSVSYGGTSSTSQLGARAAGGLNIESVTPVGDSDYTISDKDRVVTTSAPLSAPRTWTLPPAANVNLGTQLVIADGQGSCGTVNYISVVPDGTDTINNASASFVLNGAFDFVTFTRTGTSQWIVSAHRGIIRKTFFINQTYTTPVGVKSIFVECIGGGGAGGGAAVSAGNLSVGSGGGGGAYSGVYIASPVASYLITIGAGGTGSVGNAGGNGGDTTFGAVASAGGASGGAVIAAGTGVALLQGGDPGVGSLGDRNVFGNAGGTAIRLSATVGISGQGGAGAVYSSANLPIAATSGGNIGHSYGGGGSGALTTGAAQAGGNGNSGACFVTEYY